jgi:hypothetical protein
MLDSGKVVLFHVSVVARPAPYSLQQACGYEGRGQKSGEYRGFIPYRVLGALKRGARAPIA